MTIVFIKGEEVDVRDATCGYLPPTYQRTASQRYTYENNRLVRESEGSISYSSQLTSESPQRKDHDSMND